MKIDESDLCEYSITLITKKFRDYLKRIRNKKNTRQQSKLSSLPALKNLKGCHLLENSLDQIMRANLILRGLIRCNTKNLMVLDIMRMNVRTDYAKIKERNVSLSNEKSDEGQESNEIEKNPYFFDYTFGRKMLVANHSTRCCLWYCKIWPQHHS